MGQSTSITPSYYKARVLEVGVFLESQIIFKKLVKSSGYNPGQKQAHENFSSLVMLKQPFLINYK